MSKPATGSGNVRLFDADIARFSEPRGTFLRVDAPAAYPCRQTPLHQAPPARRSALSPRPPAME